MKKKALAFIALIILCFSLVSCGNESVELKYRRKMVGIFKTYESYEEAFGEVEVIVYGEIKELKKGYFPSWNKDKDLCHTPVVLNVIKTIKGDNNVNEITYDSLGGIYGDTLFVCSAYSTNEYAVGDKILVFLTLDERNNKYTDISPSFTYLEDENGKILVEKKLLPESIKKNFTDSDKIVSFKVNTDDVIGIIENKYKTWMEKNN